MSSRGNQKAGEELYSCENAQFALFCENRKRQNTEIEKKLRKFCQNSCKLEENEVQYIMYGSELPQVFKNFYIKMEDYTNVRKSCH